jgi:hypothetical protein
MIYISLDPHKSYYNKYDNLNNFQLFSLNSYDENRRYNEIAINNNINKHIILEYERYFKEKYINTCNIGKKKFERNIKLILMFRRIVYYLSQSFPIENINKCSFYFLKIRTTIFLDTGTTNKYYNSISSFIVGPRISNNYLHLPMNGIVRIARHTMGFCDTKYHYCYYGDIYMNQLVKKYKKKFRMKKRITLILLLKNKLPMDLIRFIDNLV